MAGRHCLSITLVPTPTYASWLNRIECHFGVMVKAVFAGSDQDHEEIQSAVAAYLCRRNAEARRNRDQRRSAQHPRRLRRRRAAQRLRSVA